MTSAASPEAVPVRHSLRSRLARADLFSQEQLEAYAIRLAGQHRLAADVRDGRRFMARLEEIAQALDETYRFLTVASRTVQAVPSEDWLRDNYFVVQDQIRAVRRDLPRKFYLELPKLADGEYAGYPRVFALASELVVHTAGRLDLQTLIGFVAAYQQRAPLSVGEVWAFSIMVRVALLEELDSLAADVVAASRDREEARQWGQRLAESPAEQAAGTLTSTLRTVVRRTGRLSDAFVVELLQWLRDQPVAAAAAWEVLERELDAEGSSAEEMLRREHTREAASQLAISNVVSSMRLVGSIDWPVFFERVSIVEQILRDDPAGAYAAMDFSTRDRYRHSVEELAKRSTRSEADVARRAVELAREAQRTPDTSDRQHHVGYFLISRGRFRLEADMRSPPRVRERLSRFVFRHPALGYLGTIAFFTAIGLASVLRYAAHHGATAGDLWLIGALALLPVAEVALGLLNLLVTTQVLPRELPKLDLRRGIPERDRTFVVVPVIIDTDAHIVALLDELEVRFFANRDAHLHFALLTDLPDADQPSVPGDEALVDRARRGIAELNARHGEDRFYLFHRQRRWNPQERRWMGWERKRGKLHEFNRLLRAASDTSFVTIVGRLDLLPSTRYVITLDSDTQLPLDAARALVGTLSHPLNRPRFDPRVKRVTEGYGILQPRVGVGIVSANRTTFARVFSGHVGLDPYTTAVSDVYQDLFHEGSYVGKGIYDVDAFEAAIDGRVPENTLLSHDLFEGSFARAALCTDIHLIDDYPAHYLAAAGRQHRWARGDWQIARWIWRSVPSADGRIVPNTLPLIARWKILDNLRRSLNPLALVLLLACGWTILPGSAWLWTGLAMLVLAFPAYTQLFRSLSSRHAGVPLGEHLAAERENLTIALSQAALTVAFVAHQSAVMADAIVRTWIRTLITRRNLLEWVTADRAAVPQTLAGVWRRMWPAPAIATGLFAVVAVVRPDHLPLAAPILLLWLISPVLAHHLGRPTAERLETLTSDERAFLRRTARRTWRFFEELLDPADNWLIPDNYQDNRADVVAHRTSPTNLGLQLLSVLAAHDFGYLSATAVLDHLEPTFDTLLRMQRYRGHFFNWYDTRTLTPLSPAYISTVDSGNLAGYLLTLRSGLTELIDSPLVDVSALEGTEDALNLAEESLPHVARSTAGQRWTLELQGLRAALATRPVTVHDWRKLLEDVRNRVAAAGALLDELEHEDESEHSEVSAAAEAGYWLERAAVGIAGRAAELERLTAWMRGAPEFERWRDAPMPTPARLAEWCEEAIAELDEGRDLETQRALVAAARREAQDLIERADRLAGLADDLLEEIEFDFLFSAERQLFAIGFSVTDGRLDNSHYDLLASEARLGSFMAIATGKLPQEHWFKLGRTLTPTGGGRALLSWSGSMFEYLMPLLVMRTHRGTLLDETYRAVLARQIDYGSQRGVPWGISESAYNVTDLEGNYQYRAFGVPGLGLKRGLADDLVVAPYATLLAAPLSPRAVVRNLQRLHAEGLSGRFGLYEAIDYTAERLPQDATGGAVLVTCMAHHQGMSLIALDNAVHDSPMQRRFHADPRVQAAELLLHERIPQLVPLRNPPAESAEHVPSPRAAVPPRVRRYVTPHTLSPRTHLLSNGAYSVMITNAGGGYSRRHELAMTRWREDITTDDWGTFIYLRDLETGRLWSSAHQPTGTDPDEYEAIFSADRAVFRRSDDDIETRTEIVVSPEDDVEIRRVSLTNHSGRARSLDVTSYAEVVLARHDADLAHPAFSNLFIETRAVVERDALVCARRPRSGDDRPCLVHVLSGRGRVGPAAEYETDRGRFVGRGRTLARPYALAGAPRLSNTTGPVLDPIVSLRLAIRLPAGGTARLAFATGFAASEPEALALIEKYHDRRAVARAMALAGTHSQIELRHLGLTLDDTLRFQRLGGRLIYGDPRLRSVEALQVNRRGQSELWKHGISGDLPILLARISDVAELPLVRELLQAHEYLRRRGLLFELVVINEHAAGYRQDLQDSVQQMVEGSPERPWLDRPGGIFLRRAELIEPEDQILIRAAARAVMEGAAGSLHQQLTRPPTRFDTPALTRPQPPHPRGTATSAPPRSTGELAYFNGFGGFAEDGREYVIHVDRAGDGIPPAPWSNVVAHATFGFAATELTPGCTWSGNSHDNRLTPWRNDPVRDEAGEAVFLRDDDSGEYWSTTPLPAGRGPYTVRHTQGATTYEHVREEIRTTLQLSVPPDDAVKLFHLRLRNESAVPRRLSATLYVEWVLGEHRARTRSHVVTGREPATGALTAVNAFREAFADRMAFVDLSVTGKDGHATRTITGDRTEFIGRNGALQRPAAMSRDLLSDRVGAALDPCGAVQIKVTLDPGEERLVIGLLGEAADADAVRDLVQRYRQPSVAAGGIERTRAFWDELLSAIQVKTPEPSMDLLLNRWLLYQALACRIWGRTAFYQSSGAFGFRDQLQDVLAFTFTRPKMVREQLLRAASRQFLEGDVQHWWHEPGGQGVRTRFSDDRLWLVYATLQYVDATGDAAVWEERVPFLEGRLLDPDEHEAYERPAVSGEAASLYEHCVRAVAISLPTGAHGLPLMGIGDWNDGMSLVGAAGRGESVWLGWFLVSLLEPFARVAEGRGEADRAGVYRRHAAALTAALDAAWDGEWYRRAYFDDGTPLGSHLNEECRIDAIAQSWATISGAGHPERARQALDSLQRHLVREEHRLILLLTPPFDKMRPSPGYIQGYVPGVRENGGQYTHAALWSIMALALQGNGDRAEELFRLANPINHARSSDGVRRYRVEPYVVAADVYAQPKYPGRGGWTWYTGSAGWMYRVGIETILGFQLDRGALRVSPCIPRAWKQFEATIRYGRSSWRLRVENPDGVNRGVRQTVVDGTEQTEPLILLADDGGSHEVHLIMGRTL